jgi:hypothetical protein
MSAAIHTYNSPVGDVLVFTPTDQYPGYLSVQSHRALTDTPAQDYAPDGHSRFQPATGYHYPVSDTINFE